MLSRKPRPFLSFVCIAAAAVVCSPRASAQQACHPDRSRLASDSTFNLRIDNDMFGADGQDQGYSNGFAATWVSPNILERMDDPCLPPLARRVNRGLAWLLRPDDGFDELNMSIGLGQSFFTPTDRKRTDLVADDRPYAAALMFSLGYNAASEDNLRTSQLRLGIVGPSARGRQVQNGWHKVIGTESFDGWSHQLRDEPVFQWIHERRRRLWSGGFGGGWRWDAIGHAGGSLGNFATYANTGMEWRFGLPLPEDFGTAPLRPAGENTSPVSPASSRRGGWGGHLFVALDARWVLHDITLDGNSFKDSHSVDKRPFVADAAYGLAMTRGDWKLAFTRYHRTKEFRGQKETPVYGSVTIGRRF